jgi:cyclin D5, plant
LSSALLLQVRTHWRKNLFLHFSSLPPAHARALIDAMGDAAAAAASTSAPTTPTSILICLEDGSDLLADADDGAGTDLVVARDERLLVVDQDEEYVALLLSKESASGGGSPVEEMEDWMKAARSGCVRWIIKVVSALFLFRHFFLANVHIFFLRCSQTTAMFRFGGKTAYVAVNYLDRFLAQRRVNVTTDCRTLLHPFSRV